MKLKNIVFACLLLSCTAFLAEAQVFINVGINQPPPLVAGAGQDVSICAGDSIAIGAVATGGTGTISYSWSPATGLSDPNAAMPMASPASSTSFSTTASDGIGCTSMDTVLVTVNPLPVPAFQASSNLLQVSFLDLTAPAASSWAWDFGDGNSSTQQNPLYTYTSPGTYLVCLTTTNTGGCMDSTCQSVTVMEVGMPEPLSDAQIQVYPNPYNDQTKISYVIDAANNVHVAVYNLEGKLIQTLADEAQDAGAHSFNFSARALGHAAGMYVVRIQIGEKRYNLRVMEVE